MDELKKAFEDLKQAVAEMRQANDERLAQMEKRGKVDPLLEEKVDKANADVTRLQGLLDELNTRANRAPVLIYGPDGRPLQGEALTPDEQKHVKAMNEYLRKGHNADSLRELETRANQGNLDEEGGYLLAKPAVGRIVQKVYETTALRPYAYVETISSDKLEGTVDNEEADSGWVGETQTRAETGTPGLGKWEIPVFEIYAEPKQTQRFLDDAAVDVEGWLARKVSSRFSRQENYAFAQGNGVNKPRGICAYPTAATADATRPWGTVEHIPTGVNGDFPITANFPGDKIHDLTYALKAEYRSNARFIMPRAVEAKIRKFKDGQGQYLWTPGIAAGKPAQLAGYEIIPGEDMPVLAAGSLSMAFGDWMAAYTIVDRMGIRVIRDNVTLKGWVKFYSTKRVGGGVTNFEAYKLMKFS